VRSNGEHIDQQGSDSYAELNLLKEVSRTPEVTQRSLASRLGISLGLTNLLLRNLAHKGYVRVAKANWRRRLYALTPQGMAHRLLLTGAYVSRVLDHYQKIKLILQEELEPLSLHEESSLAILGTGDFAELVYLGLKELGVESIDVFTLGDPDGTKFLGMPIRDISNLQPVDYDRVVVAILEHPENSYSYLHALGVSKEQMVTFFGPVPPEIREKQIVGKDALQEVE